jgi:hypothetical protein
MKALFSITLVFAAAACTPTSTKTAPDELDIDSLLSFQVTLLAEKGVSLSKSAAVSGHPSDTVLSPTSTHWGEELEVFRDLGILNRTLYRGSYRIEDPLDDPRSNLNIRRLTNDKAPLRSLQIFYQGDLARIRQLTGVIEEVNPLYSAHRELTLRFDELNGQLALSGYSVEGFQKVALRDTVWFSVHGTVNW